MTPQENGGLAKVSFLFSSVLGEPSQADKLLRTGGASSMGAGELEVAAVCKEMGADEPPLQVTCVPT